MTATRAGLALTDDGSGLVDFRLAQVANFAGPNAGGIGAATAVLGGFHLRRGGSRLLVLPHVQDDERSDGAERIVRVSSPPLPGSGGGHRLLVARRPVREALARFGPDVVEVHDQTTLGWVTAWASRRRIPTVLFAHEYLPLVTREIAWPLPSPATRLIARRWGARLAAAADAVVCASAFAAGPYEAIGATVHRIPFGVDLDVFAPRPETLDRAGVLRLITVGRLSPEKRPGDVLDVVAALRDLGVPVELVMVGTGPQEEALRRRVREDRLPVSLLGRITDRERVAELTAAADVALSLGRRETFGLAVLEAMACGTPVVVSDRGAARELLAPHTGAAVDGARAGAHAVLRLAADPWARHASRRRARGFSWQAAADRLLDLQLTLLAERGRGGSSGAQATSGHGVMRTFGSASSA